MVDGKFVPAHHGGYRLDDICQANGLGKKTGWGGSAPIDWQLGHFGRLIDYCMNDVMLTTRLLLLIAQSDFIYNPRYIQEDAKGLPHKHPRKLKLRKPW